MSVQSIGDLPLILQVADVQRLLGISKTSAYALVNSGDLPSVRIGRSFRVTRFALAKFLGLDAEPHPTL